MSKIFRVGLLLTSIAIALNAVAYHALKPRLDDMHLALFETASRYLIWGALWIMVLALAKHQWALSKIGFRLILVGLTLFCGSLFLYCVFPVKILMMITPMGGICLISGFAICAFKKK